MSLTFNQFQKELQKRNIDPQLAYMLSVVFEQQVETAKQMDMCAKVIEELVKTVANFATLHEATQGRVQDLVKELDGDRTPGVHVTTEPGKGN